MNCQKENKKQNSKRSGYLLNLQDYQLTDYNDGGKQHITILGLGMKKRLLAVLPSTKFFSNKLGQQLLQLRIYNQCCKFSITNAGPVSKMRGISSHCHTMIYIQFCHPEYHCLKRQMMSHVAVAALLSIHLLNLFLTKCPFRYMIGTILLLHGFEVSTTMYDP